MTLCWNFLNRLIIYCYYCCYLAIAMLSLKCYLSNKVGVALLKFGLPIFLKQINEPFYWIFFTSLTFKYRPKMWDLCWKKCRFYLLNAVFYAVAGGVNDADITISRVYRHLFVCPLSYFCRLHIQMLHPLAVGIKVLKLLHDRLELGLACSVSETVEVYIFMMCILWRQLQTDSVSSVKTLLAFYHGLYPGQI